MTNGALPACRDQCLPRGPPRLTDAILRHLRPSPAESPGNRSAPPSVSTELGPASATIAAPARQPNRTAAGRSDPAAGELRMQKPDAYVRPHRHPHTERRRRQAWPLCRAVFRRQRRRHPTAPCCGEGAAVDDPAGQWRAVLSLDGGGAIFEEFKPPAPARVPPSRGLRPVVRRRADSPASSSAAPLVCHRGGGRKRFRLSDDEPNPQAPLSASACCLDWRISRLAGSSAVAGMVISPVVAIHAAGGRTPCRRYTLSADAAAGRYPR